MDSRRRQRGDYYNPDVARARSHNKKPPPGSWQPTVPSWEKKFCTSVGSVPWGKILEIKRFMHLYPSVVQWNDSAGEEAFCNAKTRFYAKINGRPCDISLPDPDIYIDDVDWDSKIDPELVLDLEREPVIRDADEKYENVLIFDNSPFADQGFSNTGWGDNEEDLKKTSNSCSKNNDNSWDCNLGQSNGAVEGNKGWGDFGNNSSCLDESNEAAVRDSGRGDGHWYENNNNYGSQGVRDSGQGDGHWYENNNNNYGSQGVKDRNTDGEWGRWDVNNGKREGTGRYMSRYKTSRFRGEDHQRNHPSRNGNGWKRVNFVSEKPTRDTRPASRQWNASAKSGDRWGWDKPVP